MVEVGGRWAFSLGGGYHVGRFAVLALVVDVGLTGCELLLLLIDVVRMGVARRVTNNRTVSIAVGRIKKGPCRVALFLPVVSPFLITSLLATLSVSSCW